MRIEVLGPIQVTVDGRPRRLAGQRQRAVLAALTLEFGKVVPVGKLVDTLWDQDPPATARVKVQAHISTLRQVIGQGTAGPVLTRPPGYMLSAEHVEIDLAEFDAVAGRAKEAAESGDPASASVLLGTALALWRGTAYADVASPLIRAAADSLDDRRLLAWEAKAEADLALGRSDQVVAGLRGQLAAYPFRERMRGMLMLALYRLGCRADALAVYRQGHQLMVAELGLEPGPPLRSLQQRILADDPLLLGRLAPGNGAPGPIRTGLRSSKQRDRHHECDGGPR